jgi:hypothetical protein
MGDVVVNQMKEGNGIGIGSGVAAADTISSGRLKHKLSDESQGDATSTTPKENSPKLLGEAKRQKVDDTVNGTEKQTKIEEDEHRLITGESIEEFAQRMSNSKSKAQWNRIGMMS